MIIQNSTQQVCKMTLVQVVGGFVVQTIEPTEATESNLPKAAEVTNLSW